MVQIDFITKFGKRPNLRNNNVPGDTQKTGKNMINGYVVIL